MQTNVSDEMLLIDLKKGSCCAFEAIYLRYWRQLFAFVYQQLGNRYSACCSWRSACIGILVLVRFAPTGSSRLQAWMCRSYKRIKRLHPSGLANTRRLHVNSIVSPDNHV
jgi:hypothetical protein